MEQVAAFSRRFQLSPAVTSQASEFYRLAEIRGMLGMRGVSSSSLALVCLEIASGQHGEPFDKKQAQKMSGLQPRAYASALHSISKILNLSTAVSLRDLAIRFGCLEAEQLATETLHNYREMMQSLYSEAQRESVDITRPLYPAAALYTSCRQLKIRSDKARFQSAANCPSRSVFQTVLDQMNRCVPKTSEGEKERRSSKKKSEAKSLDKDTGSSKASNSGSDVGGLVLDHTTHTGGKRKRETLQSRVVNSPLCEDYLLWKRQVLALAEAKIATENS